MQSSCHLRVSGQPYPKLLQEHALAGETKELASTSVSAFYLISIKMTKFVTKNYLKVSSATTARIKKAASNSFAGPAVASLTRALRASGKSGAVAEQSI